MNYTGTAPNAVKEWRGIAHQVAKRLGGVVLVEPADNQGVGSQTTADIDARRQAAVVANRDWVITLQGVNDHQKGMSVDNSMRNIIAQVRYWRDMGLEVVVIAELPVGVAAGFTSQQMADHIELRRRIKQDIPQYGACVSDPFPLLADANGVARSEFFVDDKHLNPWGCDVVARQVAQDMNAFYNFTGGVDLPYTNDRYIAYSSGSQLGNRTGSLVANPLFDTSAGVSNIPNSMNEQGGGVLAGSWSLVGSTMTGLSTRVYVEPAAIGNNQCVRTFGSAASGAYYSLQQTVDTSQLVVGDTIRAASNLDLSGDLTGIKMVCQELRVVRGGTTYYVRDGNAYAEYALSPLPISAPFETPAWTYDGTETSILQRSTVYFRNVSNVDVTVKTSRMWTKKDN